MHYTQGGACQIERRRNGRRPRAQQQHITGLLSQVSTRAHGNAGVGLGQGGGVVDAVAHHGHAQAALLQGANAGQLACRIKAGFDLGDSRLVGYGRGCGGRVAGQHQHTQPRAPQGGHSLGGIVAQCVAGIEATRRHAIQRHPQPRHAQFRRRNSIS